MNTGATTLLHLPNELLLAIAQWIPSQQDLYSFTRTSVHLHRLLNDYLYEHNVKYEGSKALLWAAYHGHEKTVQKLLEKGANPNMDGSARHIKYYLGDTPGPPLHLAAMNGYISMTRILIEKGASIDFPDRDGLTPLMHAAREGVISVVMLLLENGADVSAKDSHLWTALFHAVWEEREDIVPLLLERGADINHRDHGLYTPLMGALVSRSHSMIKLLLDNKPDVNATDEDCRPILWFAIEYGDESLVRWATEQGADVNHRCDDGSTPLMWAVRSYKPLTGVIRVLLEMGVDPDPVCENDSSALSAARLGHEEIFNLLVEWGADVNRRIGPADCTPLDLAKEKGFDLKAIVPKGSTTADFGAELYPN
ncbi:hypothetical protein FQN51_006839 [Onygenales sp. PD_10]|nr:hypothetical protein FQN51_006839 [Onygenales sp. PD_10]